ncbi:MAG: hypothetical protein WC648_04070 [Candidatus Paceibacterota bacterium]|jgi:hypothetical protein
MSDMILNLDLYVETPKKVKIGDEEYQVSDLSTSQMFRVMYIGNQYSAMIENIKKGKEPNIEETDRLENMMYEFTTEVTGMTLEQARRLKITQVFKIIEFLNKTENKGSSKSKSFLEDKKEVQE